MWGYSLAFWDAVVLWTLVVGMACGAFAVFLTGLSSFISMKTSAILQEDSRIAIENAQSEGRRAGEAASKANERAAAANERAAELERETAKARLETEQIKQTVEWRSLPPQVASALQMSLAKHPGKVNLRYTDGDPEALFLAIQFSQVLSKAGWEIAPGAVKLMNALSFGLSLPDREGNDAKFLRDAFSAAKIPFSGDPLPPIGAGFLISTIPGAPTLMVGSKPRVFP
jgi:hypothetical protein